MLAAKLPFCCLCPTINVTSVLSSISPKNSTHIGVQNVDSIKDLWEVMKLVHIADNRKASLPSAGLQPGVWSLSSPTPAFLCLKVSSDGSFFDPSLPPPSEKKNELQSSFECHQQAPKVPIRLACCSPFQVAHKVYSKIDCAFVKRILVPALKINCSLFHLLPEEKVIHWV